MNSAQVGGCFQSTTPFLTESCPVQAVQLHRGPSSALAMLIAVSDVPCKGALTAAAEILAR